MKQWIEREREGTRQQGSAGNPPKRKERDWKLEEGDASSKDSGAEGTPGSLHSVVQETVLQLFQKGGFAQALQDKSGKKGGGGKGSKEEKGAKGEAKNEKCGRCGGMHLPGLPKHNCPNKIA